MTFSIGFLCGFFCVLVALWFINREPKPNPKENVYEFGYSPDNEEDEDG